MPASACKPCMKNIHDYIDGIEQNVGFNAFP